jgi:hypothetical protein
MKGEHSKAQLDELRTLVAENWSALIKRDYDPVMVAKRPQLPMAAASSVVSIPSLHQL